MTPEVTVSELCQQVSATLEQAFDREVWVRGTISGITRNKHVYFNLIDPDPDQRAVSVVSVVMFSEVRQNVNKMLRGLGVVRMADGIEVKIRGKVRFYPPQGRVQLVMSAIDPAYTVGQIELARVKLKRELEAAGLLETNKQIPQPIAPFHVGLVTSVGSAAEADFVNELGLSPYEFRLSRFDARVQGPDAPQEIAAGIVEAARRCEIVVVTRGGGARSDLAAFDHAEVAYTIARCPVPVIVGVGHETDVAVADAVAAITVKTPTAAASHLVERLDRFAARVADAATRLERATGTGVQTARDRVVAAEQRLHSAATRVTTSARAEVESRQSQLVALSTAVLAHHDRRLVRAETLVAALDPEVMLRRGWTVTHTAGGTLVRSPLDAPAGTEMVTRTAAGSVASTSSGELGRRASRPVHK